MGSLDERIEVATDAAIRVRHLSASAWQAYLSLMDSWRQAGVEPANLRQAWRSYVAANRRWRVAVRQEERLRRERLESIAVGMSA